MIQDVVSTEHCPGNPSRIVPPSVQAEVAVADKTGRCSQDDRIVNRLPSCEERRRRVVRTVVGKRGRKQHNTHMDELKPVIAGYRSHDQGFSSIGDGQTTTPTRLAGPKAVSGRSRSGTQVVRRRFENAC